MKQRSNEGQNVSVDVSGGPLGAGQGTDKLDAAPQPVVRRCVCKPKCQKKSQRRASKADQAKATPTKEAVAHRALLPRARRLAPSTLSSGCEPERGIAAGAGEPSRQAMQLQCGT